MVFSLRLGFYRYSNPQPPFAGTASPFAESPAPGLDFRRNLGRDERPMGTTRTARRFPASEGSAMEVERDWRRLGWGGLLILLGAAFLVGRFEGGRRAHRWTPATPISVVCR